MRSHEGGKFRECRTRKVDSDPKGWPHPLLTVLSPYLLLPATHLSLVIDLQGSHGGDQ